MIANAKNAWKKCMTPCLTTVRAITVSSMERLQGQSRRMIAASAICLNAWHARALYVPLNVNYIRTMMDVLIVIPTEEIIKEQYFIRMVPKIQARVDIQKSA